MSRKFFAVFISVLVAVGWLSPGLEKVGAEGPRNGGPVISRAFASKQLRPGDTWKIYFNASHPDGKMRKIFTIVEQPGVGTYPVSITKIKQEDRKEISGYMYLTTLGAGNLMNFVTLTLILQIQDETGKFSQPAVFPLSFQPLSVQQEEPPQGVFKERDLGPVMIQLRTIGDGSGSDFSS